MTVSSKGHHFRKARDVGYDPTSHNLFVPVPEGKRAINEPSGLFLRQAALSPELDMRNELFRNGLIEKADMLVVAIGLYGATSHIGDPDKKARGISAGLFVSTTRTSGG